MFVRDRKLNNDIVLLYRTKGGGDIGQSQDTGLRSCSMWDCSSMMLLPYYCIFVVCVTYTFVVICLGLGNYDGLA